MSKFDVFLAYNSKDKEAAETIASDLKRGSITPWFDQWVIKAGDDWYDAIQHGLEESACVAVLQGSSGLGRWENKEAKAALRSGVENGLRVIPVIIEGVEGELQWPFSLATVERVDFRDQSSDPLQKLIEAIQCERDKHRDKPEWVYHGGAIERVELCNKFLEFARQRDIVFAIGGVGSGLKTFLVDFEKYLIEKEYCVLKAVDLDTKWFDKIRASRIGLSKHVGPDNIDVCRLNLNLKCLLASLAYSAYRNLRQEFDTAIDDVVPPELNDPVLFAEWYFSNSGHGAMQKAAGGPIVELFFKILNRFVETVPIKGILAFMPWDNLAQCIGERSDTDWHIGAFSFWKTLGDLAAKDGDAGLAHSMYDRVCIVVAGTQLPCSDRDTGKYLLRKCIWPVPPFCLQEIIDLVKKLHPELGKQVWADSAEELLRWSGGSPWLIKLALGFLFSLPTDCDPTTEYGIEKINHRLKFAEDVLNSESAEAQGHLRDHLRHYMERMEDSLKEGEATDSLIEEAWAGPPHRVKMGCKKMDQRLETLVASGLVWLEGDPWHVESARHVFKHYPTVHLRRASRLAVAAYRKVTGRPLQWVEYKGGHRA